jgi:hypothetical protein
MLAGARAAAAESGVAAQPGRRMNHFASLCSHLALVLLLPGGCVYLPETTTRYDPDCGIYERKATPPPPHAAAPGRIPDGMPGRGLRGSLLVAAGAVTAASAVISGSVVVVGNVVYWLEKQVQCRNPPREPPDSGALPANRQGTGLPP